MSVETREELEARLAELRRILEPAFAPDTALGPFNARLPSTGHCAAVSAIVECKLGGSFVSATVSGVSHWFNRFAVGSTVLDTDITGDQFGYPKIRIAEKGQLYPGTRERQPAELNEETRKRARVLAQRAGLVAFLDESKISSA